MLKVFRPSFELVMEGRILDAGLMVIDIGINSITVST